MSSTSLSDLLARLTDSPSLEGVFSPWADADEENDIGSHCNEVRRRQCHHYLETRLKTAKCLLVGEALGYQGGHFTGIPMTSERILLGHQVQNGISPKAVLPGLKPERTSKPEKMPNGFTEPTATIVWQTLLQLPLSAQEFVLWNAFPWHPFDKAQGMLSNRKPTAREMSQGLDILQDFFRLFPGNTVVAVGKVAETWLKKLGIDAFAVRHPAQGGAEQFRTQITALLGKV
jgi:uracil-DNA glycosylase